jgi:hypothetical protein
MVNSCYYTMLAAGPLPALALWCTEWAPLQKQATQSLKNLLNRDI